MSIITSHELTKFYEQYRDTEVTFTKQVLEATGLQPQGFYIKLGGHQWPCVVYACSMSAAKIIATLRAGFHQALQKADGHLSLHLLLRRAEKTDPLSFFVAGRVAGMTAYNPQSPDQQLLTLEFSTRPSDDLIQTLGVLLEANTNAQRRRDERITLTPDALKRMGLESRECTLTIAGIGRKCIIRDISFGGAKVLVAGAPASLNGQPVGLKIARGESSEELNLWGEVARGEEVYGHPDISALGIKWVGEPPMAYKLLISGYLSAQRRGAEPAPPSTARRGGASTGG